ncbi:hypothetical protein [Candidatus Rariloculus sp.]|uniref:hypothetical protein n=1 Tax=Candidatus Rariloculus sp. TaxID=3101265 RepID=UPI003D0E89F4
MSDSSDAYGTVSNFDAKRSATLALWWVALHVLLWSTALALTRDIVPGLLALAVLAGHAAVRFPDSQVVLTRSGDGRWSIPGRGLFDLALGSGTCYSTLWVILDLAGQDGSTRVLLLRDQLGAADWRRLQVAVREPES